MKPNAVVEQFEKAVDQAEHRYQVVIEGLREGANTSARRQLAADAMFRVATAWESFAGEWHLAAIHSAPQRFIARKKAVVDTYLKSLSEVQQPPESLLVGFGVNTNFETTRELSKLSLQRIRELLDPSGANITFGDPIDWWKQAQRELEDPYKTRLSKVLNSHEKVSSIRLLQKVRNQLAHGSTQSLSALREAVVPALSEDEWKASNPNKPAIVRPGLSGLGTESLLRSGPYQVGDVATYLATESNGTQRWKVLTGLMRDIGRSLRIA